MRVLTLGWEYPPHIAGGLGTACKALTDNLARLGVEVDLVVPHLFGDEEPTPARLIDAASVPEPAGGAPTDARGRRWRATRASLAAAFGLGPRAGGAEAEGEAAGRSGEAGPHMFRIPALLAPYWQDDADLRWAAGEDEREEGAEDEAAGARGGAPRPASAAAPGPAAAPAAEARDPAGATREEPGGAAPPEPDRDASASPRAAAATPPAPPAPAPAPQRPPDTQPTPPRTGPQHRDDPYGSRLFHEIRRFGEGALRQAERGVYDLVHAHDWMTFPAGIAAADALGCPLVVHVHSTEYDRAGEGAQPRIVDVERLGMESATLVIAVSHYTRSIILRRYAIAPDKVVVVHNGVYPSSTIAAYRRDAALEGRKVVLYMGRVTFQKGPDYFVEAAARVLRAVPEAHFLLAGNGDMLPRLEQRVRDLGIASHFTFPGFVRGRDVERMFCQADVFVMPSVSEPFGLVALEAMSNRTPVIVSRQSGVAEALRHVLKFDFWDVDDLAAKVVALLRYEDVGREMVARAAEEVTRFQWASAADKVRGLYARLVERAGARGPTAAAHRTRESAAGS